MHESNSFVTLTYSEENLPEDGCIRPEILRDFMKRLRYYYAPEKVRFFGVGEYGDDSWRPHYHLSLFGLGQLDTEIVKKAWPFGFVSVYEFNYKTASYTCGYVIKKMTRKRDPKLGGREPEFARMSNRPGLGATAMSVVRDSVLTDAGLDFYEELQDVPREVRMQGKKFGLGRYLRRKLREEVGVSEAEEAARVQAWIDESQIKLLPLQQASIEAKEGLSIPAIYARSRKGRIAQVEAREKLSANRRRSNEAL